MYLIQVTDDYYIDVSDTCYAVKFDKRKLDKKGKPMFEVIGYYSNFSFAVAAVIESMNKKQLMIGVHTLEQALEIVNANVKQFTELLDKVVNIND